MEVVRPEHRLNGQGLCFICEKAIDHPKEKAIRTGHDFDPLFQTPLAGDKYVCESCADTLAQTLGYISPGTAEMLIRQGEDNANRLRRFQELAGALTSSELPAPVPGAVTATKEKKQNGSKT